MSLADLPRVTLPTRGPIGQVVFVDLAVGERPVIVSSPTDGRDLLLVLPGEQVAFISRHVRLSWLRRLWMRLWREPVPTEWRLSPRLLP